MVADLTLLTAVERACDAELTEKETTVLHGGSVAEAKKVAATFPECLRYSRKSQSRVGLVFLSQFEVPWGSKGGSHCEEITVLRKSKNVKVGRKSGSRSRNW